MALQVWIPGTDGTLKNQGLYPLPKPSYNNIVSTNDGKLGKDIKNFAIYHLNSDFIVSSWSICTWIKFSSTWSESNNIIFAKNTSDSEDSQIYLSIVNNTTLNIGRGVWNGFTYQPSNGFQTGVWYHIAATCDGTNVTLYLNGFKVAGGSSIGSYKSALNLCIGCRSTNAAGTWYTGWGPEQNDIRLYDHCLSPKEIKEISKGLVLHYPLNDAYVEGTTNLVTSITKGGQTTVNGYEVTTSGVSKDTYFTLNLSEKIVAGNTYTISCRNNFDTGLYWDFPIGSQANQTLTWRITPGYSSYTFVANSGNSYWDKNTCFMDDLSGTARNASKSFKMWDWQIEKKDHATPFVIGTRNETTVYDCSGYQNNGTVSGNVTLSVDSPRYIGSYKFIPNAMISAPGIVNFDKCTYSVWCKDPNMSYKIVFCDGTSKVAFGESSGFLCSCGSNSQNKFTKNNWKNSDWNHVVIVRDGSTYKMYINGEAETQSGTADYWNHSASTITVGGREENAAMWNGNISDFRIYTTALSADDIKELYNTSCIVNS